MQGIRQDRDTVPGTGCTWVQAIWNQVLQDLQAIEGREQPTCLEQTPHGLFLVQYQITMFIFGTSVHILKKLCWALTLSFCRKALFAIMYNCRLLFVMRFFVDANLNIFVSEQAFGC